MTRTFLGTGAWRDERGANLLDGGAPNYRCYACADGRYIAVGALEPRFWTELLRGLGLDPQTTPSPYEPAQWDACAELLAATFATRTRDEWAAVFEPLDACVAPVLTLAEAPAHPHSAERVSYVSVGGAIVAAPTPRFSATPGAPGQLSLPGADTAAVLAELGYSSVDVEALRAAGAIG